MAKTKRERKFARAEARARRKSKKILMDSGRSDMRKVAKKLRRRLYR